MVTALWALEDFTAANGATRVVPGSRLRPVGKPDAAEAVPAEMPAGSVLLFSGRLYHGAGANATSRPRLGVVIDYIQPWLRPSEVYTLSASHAEARQLPQRLQELLGRYGLALAGGYGLCPRDGKPAERRCGPVHQLAAPGSFPNRPSPRIEPVEYTV